MPGIYETQLPNGLRKQTLGEEIYAVEAFDTPFLSLVPTGDKPNGMMYTWPAQKYPRRGFGGVMDGYDVDQYDSTMRDPIEGICQWLMESWKNSKLSQLSKTAGVSNEQARQAADALLIFKKKMHRLFLSTQDLAVETGASQPYQTRGALAWLVAALQSFKPVDSKYMPSSGCVFTGNLSDLTPRAFEAMLETASVDRLGAVDLTGYCGIKVKSRMSEWPQKAIGLDTGEAALSRYNMEMKDKRLINCVDRFEFDAGKVETIPVWDLACDPVTGEDTAYTARSAMFVEPSMWEKRFLQPIESVVEPPKSGGPRGYHDAVVSLSCKNGAGQLAVYTNED